VPPALAALAAALPLAVVLVAMGALHRSAAQAGAAAVAVAGVLAFTLFDLAAAAPGGAVAASLGTLAEAGFSAATILWIILPALALYEFQGRSGALLRIRDALAGLTPNRRLQAILIAWFFGLFMEGAAGFGTPVALSAPLLVGFGYGPVRAVALALLGHAAGVSFGAVGTPALVQADLAGLDPRALAGTTALLHAALAPALLWAMVRMAGEGPLSGAERRWTALAAACFLVPSLALAALAGPELPTLGGALLGAAAFVALLRRAGGGALPPARGLLADLAPYLLILALVLATRLAPPLREAALAVELGWALPGGFSGSFAPLYHPGTLLLAGLVIGALATGRAATLGPALGAGLRRLAPVALALLFMLALSRTMVHSGMIEALAGAAAATGLFWPLLAPAIGVLGTFITGSATASNILFTDLQTGAAARLGLPPAALAAAQGFGAAIGNTVAPHNIIAGCATVGGTGREGEILARTLLACALYAAAGGGLALVLTGVL
jgi:lactate permease